MFTHTIDTALDRWTDAEGFEFAYTHDQDAENPFDWGWEGICLLSDDYRRGDAGDIGVADSLKSWLIDLEEYQFDAANLTDEDDEEVKAAVLKALADHEAARPEVEWFDYAGYRVYVDVPTYEKTWGGTYDKSHVQGMVDTYLDWAEGNVYVGAVTTPEGDTEYLGGIYLDDARDDRSQIEELMRDFV